MRPLSKDRLPFGVTGVEDALRRTHFEVSDELTRHSPAYRALLRRYLDRKIEISACSWHILSLILTEAVRTIGQLRQLLDASVHPIMTVDGAIAYWDDDGWPECRQLSSFSLLTLQRLALPIDWDRELDLMERWLQEEGLRGPLRLPQAQRPRLTALIRGGLAFWQLLSPVLTTHVFGCQTLTPVSARSYARLQTLKVLADDDLDAAPNPPTGLLDACSFNAAGFWSSPDANHNIERIATALTARSDTGRKVYKSGALERLAVIYEDVSPDDAESNTGLAFAFFMLQVGTPMAKQPSPVIVPRYFNALARACRNLEYGMASLVRMTDDERVAQYRALIDANAHDDDLRKGIGAFHFFLVVQLGAAPVWLRGKAVDVKVPPRTEVVWPHDKAHLLRGIALSGCSDRVQQMGVTLVELADDVPCRISDCRRLKRCDVRISGSTVFVDFRPHRNASDPKTDATVRTAKVLSDSAASALQAWCRLRADESGDDMQGWFFADGFDERNQTELAQAYTLVCSLLKVVTGEPSVSFHSFRHTSVSRLVRHAMRASRVAREWDPLEPCAARAGHASSYSTLTAYYHFAHVALREEIEFLLRPMLSAASVAAWTRMKTNTLNQRISRSRGRDELARVLDEAAARVPVSPASEGLHLKDVHLEKRAPKPMSLCELLEVVSLLDGGEEVNTVSKRSGRPPDLIERIARQRDRTMLVYPHRVRRTAWKQAKLSDLFIQVERVLRRDDAQDVALGWLFLAERGYLSLRDGRRLDPILRILGASGVPAARLVLRCSDPHDERMAQLLDQFQATMQCQPAIEIVKERDWRPTPYLKLLSSAPDFEASAPSATCSMRGFHSLFTALSIHVALNRATAAQEIAA